MSKSFDGFPMRKLKIAFWVTFAATLFIYAVMLFWSFPQITSATGGLAPFDMRPSGYSYTEAREFLAALPSEQAGFYRKVQSALLDSLYPAMLALTLFLAIGLLAYRTLGAWAWALGLLALPGAVLDYMENVNIRLMLFLGPDNITPEIVARASSRTVMKAMFTSAAMSVLLALAVLWLWKRVTARRT